MKKSIILCYINQNIKVYKIKLKKLISTIEKIENKKIFSKKTLFIIQNSTQIITQYKNIFQQQSSLTHLNLFIIIIKLT